jgi:glycine dehydrogenase
MGEIRSRFEDRHIGPAQSQIDFMLRELGHDRLDEFIAKVVPANIAINQALVDSLPPAASEEESQSCVTKQVETKLCSH